MAKYTVKVGLTYHKDLTIYAQDEEEAGEKAEELCSGWDNVQDVEILDTQEA